MENAACVEFHKYAHYAECCYTECLYADVLYTEY
jgi:hypothetical protein